MTHTTRDRPIVIIGAGPAGLAAAIAAAQRGRSVNVCDRYPHVGHRFHGDFQGIDNWSTEGDVLDEVAALGIEPSFDVAPVRECILFDFRGREYHCKSSRPIVYLVRRGRMEGTLDRALERHALAAGAELKFGHPVEQLPEEGIIASGPARTDVLAAGYVGQTDMADGAFGVLSDRLAPKGYTYLLIWRGRATLAVCLFARFHRAKHCLERALDFFRSRIGFTLRDPKPFGGYGAVAKRPVLRQGNLLYAGEAAGLQDAVFGFGIRLALASGHLAGTACATGDLSGYEAGCERWISPWTRTAIANRMLYAAGGELGYRLVLHGLSSAADSRRWLRTFYSSHWWTSALYSVARGPSSSRSVQPSYLETHV